MQKRDYKRIESKEREWDLAIRASKRHFVRNWEIFKVKFKVELRRMINFIMFYAPSDKLDRKWHIFEMIVIYIVLQCALIGIRG